MAITRINQIQSVKYVAFKDDPYNFKGYLVNGNIYEEINSQNNTRKIIQQWIAAGNTPDPAYTPEEIEQNNFDLFVEMTKNTSRDLVNTQIKIHNETQLDDISDLSVCMAKIILGNASQGSFCQRIVSYNITVIEKATEIRNKVKQGVISMPTEAEFRAMLPIFS